MSLCTCVWDGFALSIQQLTVRILKDLVCRTKSLNVYTYMKHVIECIYFHTEIHIAKAQGNVLIKTSFYSFSWLRPDWLPGAGKISISCLFGIPCFVLRVLNRFFGICHFGYLKARIRDFKAKWGQDSGLKVRTMWNAENNPRDYGIEQKFGSGRMTELKNPIGDSHFCFGQEIYPQ